MYVLHKIDAAQAFDELSILQIKASQSRGAKKEQLFIQINVLWKEIVSSLGGELSTTIYQSDYYTNLYQANLVVFHSVDKFRDHELPKLTMARYFAKKELQEHFFNNKLTEVKTQDE